MGKNRHFPKGLLSEGGNGKLYRELVPGGSKPRNPNQIRTVARYQSAPALLSTSLSAIIADSSNQVKLSLVPNYTYLQSLWEEYRILEAEWHIYGAAPSGTGVTAWYVDESDTTVPTLSTAGQKLGMKTTNASQATPPGGWVVRWAAQDLKDLQWSPTTSTSTVATLKAYTDGNYGCSTTSTAMWLVQLYMKIEFRGQGGN